MIIQNLLFELFIISVTVLFILGSIKIIIIVSGIGIRLRPYFNIIK